MYDSMLYLQIAKDRQAALLREAHSESLAKRPTRKEPVVRFSLTIELRLGGRQHHAPSES